VPLRRLSVQVSLPEPTVGLVLRTQATQRPADDLIRLSQVPTEGIREHRDRVDFEEGIWVAGGTRSTEVRLEVIALDYSVEEFTYRDTFVYEYVGDVVNPASFKKRMREYAAEDIQHFYFMMLQKDEVRHSIVSLSSSFNHLRSSLTRQKVVGLVVSQITAVNQTVTSQSGR
jgi:hypothetical protein